MNTTPNRKRYAPEVAFLSVVLALTWMILIQEPPAVVSEVSGMARIGDYLNASLTGGYLVLCAVTSYICLTIAVVLCIRAFTADGPSAIGRPSNRLRRLILSTLAYVGLGVIGLVPSAIIPSASTWVSSATALTAILAYLLLFASVITAISMIPVAYAVVHPTPAHEDQERMARG